MLIGQKVCLGPFLQDDAPLLFNWVNTLGLAHRNGLYRPTDLTQFSNWFNSVGGDPSRVFFSIRKQGDLRLLGYLQITSIQQVYRSADLGILIGNPTDQNQGHGQEAIQLGLAYCWRDLNLHRVALSVIGDNPHALRVYQKAGFQVEGVLRDAAYVDGGYRDVTLLGALRPQADRDGVEA